MVDAAATAIDIHAHSMPLPLLQWLESLGLADLARQQEQVVVLDPQVSGVGPGAPLPLARSMYDVPTRLAELDEVGVGRHVCSLPPFLFGSTSSDGSFVRELVQRGNDELAGYVAEAPDRLSGLGSVPLGWEGAAEEARRCLDELGMPGIAIGSRGAGKDLDDPVNEDLWALVSERRAFVFLHPSGVPDGSRLRDFWFPQLVGYPMETAIAVARLVFSGMFEKHPFPLCLAHAGGCLPSLRGRLDMGWDRKAVAHTTAVKPSELFDELYYDTAAFSDVILRRVVEDVGVEHVMLGTDHPFELGDITPLETVAALGLSELDSTKILRGNAQRLLGLS